MDYKNILIVIAAIVVLYMVYMLVYGATGSSTLTQIKDAEIEQVIEGSKLKPGNTNDYTYSAWFYVSDWSYRIGKEKVLLTRNSAHNSIAAGGDHGGSPEISLAGHENNMTVTVNTMQNSGQADKKTTCMVNNVPLQRWVNAIVSLNNRTMDIYVQGKLVRTCILPGVVDVNGNAPTTITPDGGFKGFTSNVQYFDHPLNPQEAYNIYAKGPNCGGGSWFDKYQIRLSYLVNNQEEGYIII